MGKKRGGRTKRQQRASRRQKPTAASTNNLQPSCPAAPVPFASTSDAIPQTAHGDGSYHLSSSLIYPGSVMARSSSGELQTLRRQSRYHLPDYSPAPRMGAHRNQSIASSGSKSRSGSEHTSLANVVSHYMHEVDAANVNEVLASRYYRNMSHVIGEADRIPKPMNSTLPLFSPSVVSGRAEMAAKSKGGHGSLPLSAASAASTEQQAKVGSDGGQKAPDGITPTKTTPANLRESLIPSQDESSQTSLREDSDEQSAVVTTAAPSQPGKVLEMAPPLPLQTQQQLPSHIEPELPANDTVSVQLEPSQSPSMAKAPLPLSSRKLPLDVMGSTQYHPAPSARSSILARGGPGMLHMLSPAVGSSRPSSVIGMHHPPTTPSLQPQEFFTPDINNDHVPSSVCPGFEEDKGGLQIRQSSEDTTGAAESSEPPKQYESINIGALEHFLAEGEIPMSSSDEEDDASFVSEAEATRPMTSSRCSQQIYKDVTTLSDERTPLLPSSPSRVSDAADESLIVPADLPHLSSNKHSDHSSSRIRRKRRHKEELFIDEEGIVDESYRFAFFNPIVGTIRAQEFADLRTPTMDLSALLQVGGCFWIDVLQPSFQEMHLFSKIFGIHALTVEDIMTQDAREKCEVHANYYFVCFRSFDDDPNSETYLEPKCIYNVVMREGMITFHMDPSVHQYHVMRRIRRQMDHIVVTPDWLNYAMIDDITDMLAPIIQVNEFDVGSIDDLVLVISSSEQSDMLLRISTVRRRIMMVMRLLQGKADVVRAIIKRFETATALTTTHMNALTVSRGIPTATATAAAAAATKRQSTLSPEMGEDDPNVNNTSHPPLPASDSVAIEVAMDENRKGHETILYLGDVLDHIVTMMQNVSHYDNVLSRAHANYLAQISIELTESSNRTNDVVAKLSALAAIVVPLNFVTGMWGANVKVPGQDYDSLYYFFYILGFCMLYVAIAVAWARHYNIF